MFCSFQPGVWSPTIEGYIEGGDIVNPIHVPFTRQPGEHSAQLNLARRIGISRVSHHDLAGVL